MIRRTRRLVRDAGSIAMRGSEMPAATMATLAERLPVLWGTSTAPWAWQAGEFWRMSLEKPIAFGQAWCALSFWPLQAWLAMARAGDSRRTPLPLALAGLWTGALNDAMKPVHRRVTRNARRLSRRR
jgi:hypothetical protein